MGKFKKETFYKDGKAVTEIYYDNLHFIGHADCHPDDKPYISEGLGRRISEIRALRKFGKHVLANEVRPQLKILRHLMDCMKQNKEYNPRSNEVRLLRRQIGQLETEQRLLKNDLELMNQEINDLISSHEEFWAKIKAKREREKVKND